MTIWLRPDAAPNMVERVKLLTRQKFYDGLPFHRVIDGFMAQGGDPKGDGTGGSTLPDLKAEFNFLPHVRGSVAAARAESNDSANSQFYIVFMPKLQLDNRYTVFGRVLSGMQYVDAIERGEPPANPSRIVHAYIASRQSAGVPEPAHRSRPRRRRCREALPVTPSRRRPGSPRRASAESLAGAFAGRARGRRSVRFRVAGGADRAASGEPARQRAAAGSRRRCDPRPDRRRPARAIAPRRLPGVQRHPRDPGATRGHAR